MTFKEKLSNQTRWQDKVNIIYLFHCLMVLKRKSPDKWKVRDTARYFGLSMGYISETLKLGEHMQLVKEVPSRKKALEIIK